MEGLIHTTALYTYQLVGDAHRLCRWYCNLEVLSLVLRWEEFIIDFLRKVSVQDGTQGQAIIPTGAEIGYVDVGVADRLVLAPLEEGVPLGASVLGKGGQWVLLVPDSTDL